jgi:hypothetical protein
MKTRVNHEVHQEHEESDPIASLGVLCDLGGSKNETTIGGRCPPYDEE